MKFALIPLFAGALLGGCAADTPTGTVAAATAGPITPDWRSIATGEDRERVRNWRTAWMEGVRKAQAAGNGSAITQEGALLQPDVAIQWQDPPQGEYRCRVIKVGAKSKGMLDYVAYPSFTCRVRREGGVMSFAKLTGSQRPIGLFLPYPGQQRMVFLGTLQLGDEPRALEYGRDRERDMAGVVERIGEDRWRLVLPYPHFESTIDILELIPTDANAQRTS